MLAFGNIYKNAEAVTFSDRPKLPAGGYICEIKGVEVKADKYYFNVIYDIAEGEFKGFYGDDWAKEHPFAHSFVRSYKQTGDEKKDRTIFGMMKAFLEAVDKSNGTAFAIKAGDGFDEQGLVHKRIGLVIGYEEYETDRGEVRERTRVKSIHTVEDIKEGKYKVPELKKLETKADAPASPIPDFVGIPADSIPF